MPPLTVMSLGVRTVVNHKENKREVVCATARIWPNSESTFLFIEGGSWNWDSSPCIDIIYILIVAPLHHTCDCIVGCFGISSPYRRFYSARITSVLRSYICATARSVPSKLRIQGQGELKRFHLTSEERAIPTELFAWYVMCLTPCSSRSQADHGGYHPLPTLCHATHRPAFLFS